MVGGSEMDNITVALFECWARYQKYARIGAL